MGVSEPEPAPPPAFAALAQCEGRNAVRQGRHDLAPLGGGQAEPAADLAPRAAAADAKARFGVDDADLDTGGFDVVRRKRIHGCQDRLVWWCRRHGNGIVVLENALRRKSAMSASP